MELIIFAGGFFLITIAGVSSHVYRRYMDNKEEKKREDAVKSLQNNYKEGQNPLVVANTYVYSLSKECILSFDSRNISPKAILAVEFQITLLNAFDEVIDILELSFKSIITSAERYFFNENIDKSINCSSCVIRVKRVKFIDGSIWVNEN